MGQQPPPPKPTLPPEGQVDERAQIEAAVQQAFQVQAENTPAMLIYDEVIQDVRISADGNWAMVWIALADPQTGDIAATEPGLAITRKEGEVWTAILPSDASWPEALQASPESLLTPEEKADWWVMYSDAQSEAAAVGTLGGYLLPWNGGDTLYLTGSTGHDSYITSGSSHYAFDFANGTMFPIHAAKPGIVHSVRVDCTNGDPNCSNWIILQDLTTSPTTYQLYLHMAKDSVPPGIRARGTRIHQGQFLGLADDTGASTGHHLHFHVHTNANTWWAPSVDITFADVYINGGRPRIQNDLRYCTRSTDVCQVFQRGYRSGNVFHGDAIPPEGGISAPQPGAVLNAKDLSLQGWASDVGTGVLSAQFIAYYEDAWQDVGRPFTTTTTLATNWDLCAAGVPDGPLGLALRIFDKDGNVASGFPGLRQVVNNAGCPPPPPCTPNDNQVALFADPDYSGACVLLNTGTYSSGAALGAVGDNNTASIRVGANVRARLYTDANRSGHSELLTASDLSLADNQVAKDTLSSLVVETGTAAAGGAGQETAGAPAGRAGAAILAAVRPSAAAAVVNAPWSDNMEGGLGGWTTPGATNMWDQTYGNSAASQGQISWYYGQDGSNNYNNSTNSGALVSPSITIPVDGNTYYLRFWYLYQTESAWKHWDTRKVQVSVNGGTFTDLLQLFDDPMNTWLQSRALSLAAYAGKSIQVRFLFNTVDNYYNSFKGWYIDDFSIRSDPPPNCTDSGDTPAAAVPLTPGTLVNGEVCPGGDVDYYKFHGTAGERIGAAVDAQAANPASALDSALALLDGDGNSVLAENDDQVEGQRSDSWLTYVLKRSGDYYLKVKAWNHPSAGSSQHTYTLRFHKENADPDLAAFAGPGNSSLFRMSGAIPVSISAGDAGSGVSHVVFYWHSGDWLDGAWVREGEDWNPADGWGITIPAGRIPCGTNIALYAEVVDWAGNSVGASLGDIAMGCNLVYLPTIKK
jgi:hypothetical protein